MASTDRGDPDFDDEIRAHLELETDRLIEDGLPPEEARRAARRTFGNVTSARERFYESHRVLWLDHVRQDLKSAVRSLAKYPIACAIAVISLAGGIGATTATLLIRDAVFAKPPALYLDPDRISRIQVGSPENPIRPIGNPVPGALFLTWRRASGGATLSAATMAERLTDVRTTMRQDTAPVRWVTPELFDVLGVRPAAGRSLSEVPANTSGPRPALLSHRLWQTLFDARPDAVGEIFWIANEPFMVAGVMPERFWFSSMSSPIWTPLEISGVAPDLDLEVVARRGTGVTPEQLAQQLQPGLDEYIRSLPVAERQRQIEVSNINGTPQGRSMAIMLPWLFGAAVLLTLLIACANVAILVIAQWTAREQEIAIRASLGASRARIIRALVTESMVMAGAGGVLGIAVIFALRGIIVRNAGEIPEFFDLSISPAIPIEAGLIALFCGALAGIGPALLETRRLHGNPMRAVRSSDRVRQRWRHTLVVIETSVTVALLVLTTTMVDGLRRHMAFDPGFRTRPLITVRVQNDKGVRADQVLHALNRVPGVASAAAATAIPYRAFGAREPVAIDSAGSGAVLAQVGAMSPGFFTTLDVPLRAGRGFTAADTPDSATAIASLWLARRLFGDQNPIGRRVFVKDRAYEIVGIVADYANSSFQAPDRAAKLFVPLGARPLRRDLPFLVRASGEPTALLETLRREALAVTPGNDVRVVTIDQVIAVGGQEMAVGTAPFVPLVATGMLLTAAGIYGVLAFAVARRSKELAVRIAIGATRRDLLRVVASHSLRLVLIGTVFGVGATFILSRIARAAGGGGGMMDPQWIAFVTPVAIILSIGALATWIPSRRVLRIDPVALLRAQ
jgi:putative ABC transport system permease protein